MRQKNRQKLSDFSRYWSERNLDGVVGCFTLNGVYDASVRVPLFGPAKGHSEIRALVREMFEHDAAATSTISNTIVGVTLGSWTWRYDQPNGDTAFGCDLFEFRDGLIHRKDAYRKLTLLKSSENFQRDET